MDISVNRVANCHELAAAHCRRLDQFEQPLHMEVSRHYITRTALDDVIKDVKQHRRERPWRYLACATQLSAIQAERATVEEHLQDANKRLVHFQTEGLGHLRRYARLSCRQLCAMVMTRLPREIRDTIYESLLPHSVIEVTSVEDLSYIWWNASLRMKMNTFDYRWQLQFGTSRLPQHCLDESCIGENMLREMVVTWDRTTTFEVRARALPHLLRSNHWQHGRTPTTVIRNLNVLIPCPSFQYCSQDHRRAKEWCVIPQDGPEVIRALEYLSYLDVSTKVSIQFFSVEDDTIYIPDTSDPITCGEALLRYIEPIIILLQELYKHGRRIEPNVIDKACQISCAEQGVPRST